MMDEGLIRETKGRDEGPRHFLTPKGEDAVYILLAIPRFGIRHYMGKDKPEKTVIRELHYDIPKNGWSY